MGRLFDAVAALVGLRQRASYEGQAAMELEFAIQNVRLDEAYRMEVLDVPDGPMILDWENMITFLLTDRQNGVPVDVLSARFHNGLADAIVEVARRIGEPRLALSGGCFQNAYLVERTVRRLREEGFQPFWHHQVPPNDGGIAFGQAVAAECGIEIT
jgi:hydrogenase maturation protein HypF